MQVASPNLELPRAWIGRCGRTSKGLAPDGVRVHGLLDRERERPRPGSVILPSAEPPATAHKRWRRVETTRKTALRVLKAFLSIA